MKPTVSFIFPTLIRDEFFWLIASLESRGGAGARGLTAKRLSACLLEGVQESRRRCVLTLPEELELLERFTFECRMKARTHGDTDVTKPTAWRKLADQVQAALTEARKHPLVRLAEAADG